MKNVFSVCVGYLVDKSQPTEAGQMLSFCSTFWSNVALSFDISRAGWMTAKHVWYGLVCFFNLSACMQVAQFCFND